MARSLIPRIELRNEEPTYLILVVLVLVVLFLVPQGLVSFVPADAEEPPAEAPAEREAP